MNRSTAEAARRRDDAARRLSTMTVALAAAGVVGTGAVAYAAASHTPAQSTPGSGTSTGSPTGTARTTTPSAHRSARTGTSGVPAVQAPITSQQPPIATTSGS